MSVEVLKIRIPNRRISCVEHYQHAALVNFDTGLASYTSFQHIPTTRQFVAAVEAMRFYQKIVNSDVGDKGNKHHGPVFHQVQPVWFRPFYSNLKDTVETGTFDILPLHLASDVPIIYQHIAFFVDNKYMYVFTQEREGKNPQQSALYCTCVDYKLNSENIRKILACCQHTQSDCDTPNLLNRNAFAEKAIEVSAPYLNGYWILSSANNKTY